MLHAAFKKACICDTDLLIAYALTGFMFPAKPFVCRSTAAEPNSVSAILSMQDTCLPIPVHWQPGIHVHIRTKQHTIMHH